ncbi:MAG: DciA family protein [Cocleimonas sp.]
MKNFNDLVNKQLVESIKSYDKLSNAVYAFMHLNKEKHNIWVVTKQKQLSLLTDNPYLATQLRYQQQNICLHLNQKFLMQLNVIKVKIVPPKGVRETTEESNFTISEKTEKVLADIAEDIDDAGLKESLLKLTNKPSRGL